MDLLLPSTVFVLTFLGLISIFSLRSPQRNRESELFRRMLPVAEADSASFPIMHRSAPLQGRLLGTLNRTNAGQRLAENIRQADLYMSFPEVVLMMALLFLFGDAMGQLMFGGGLFALLAGCGLAMLPLSYIQIRKRQRLKAFSQQFPFALDLMKSSLEAGHSLARGLQVVVQEFTQPLGPEFRNALDLTRIGMPLVRALEEMSKRVPDQDLSLLVTAVNVQSHAGTSLAPILGRLAELVRARQRLRLQIRSLTAQARLSGVIIGLLPVFVLFAFHLAKPSYVDVLFYDPAGLKILKVAIGLDLIALVIIRRLLKVDY
jgi:tight adherence protein B